MYTLYEIVDSAFPDRSLVVFEDFREACRYRLHLISEFKTEPEQFRVETVRTLEYWVCDGKIFYDYVLLLREFAGTGRTVTHYTSMDVLDPDAEPQTRSSSERDLDAVLTEWFPDVDCSLVRREEVFS